MFLLDMVCGSCSSNLIKSDYSTSRTFSLCSRNIFHVLKYCWLVVVDCFLVLIDFVYNFIRLLEN